MACLYFPVKEVATRIIDPIGQQVANAVLMELGLYDQFTDAIYVDNGRTAASLSDDGNGHISLTRDRCDIKVDTNYNPLKQTWDMATDRNTTALGMSRRFTNQYQQIFADTQSGVYVSEITAPFGIDLSFRLTYRSYDKAQQAISAIISQNYGNVVNHIHDIVYTYPLTNDLIAGLLAVFKCRSEYATLGFQQYLSDMATSDFSFDIRKYNLLDQTPQFQFVAKRTQLSCLAILEFVQDAPEVNKHESLPTSFSIEFTYKIQFGRPNILQLILPPVVENQPLPNTFFQTNPTSYLPILEGTLQTSFFTQYARQLYGGRDADSFIVRFPDYDDWTVPRSSQLRHCKFHPLMIGITLLDTPNPTEICFTQLQDIQLAPFVQTILGLHQQEDIFGYQGMLNITVFADGIALNPSLLTWNPTTLTVSFTMLNKIKTYRIVLSETTNIHYVDPKWYPTLLQYRYYFSMFIFRNLKALTSMGYYTVQATGLCDFVQRLIQQNHFETIIQAMIATGDTDGYIRMFTQFVWQFCDYICNTQVIYQATDSLQDQSSKTLYDTFIQCCVAANLTTLATAPPQYLKTPKGYPFGPGSGGFDNFQVPTRIWNLNVQT